jgi:MFS transporter, DHA1 family, multidrug resistance protein
MQPASISFLLYFSEFLTSLSYTITASFYPAVAESKGIPIWLIGVIFCIDPLVGLPTSLLTARLMQRFSRKLILVIGIVLGSFGMLSLGLLQFSDFAFAVSFSVLSRTLAGVGAGCSMTAAPAILLSENPDSAEKVIGYFEAASGIGFLAGPVIGAVFNFSGIFFSFGLTAIFYFTYAGVCWVFLPDYKEKEQYRANTSLKKMICKPVRKR